MAITVVEFLLQVKRIVRANAAANPAVLQQNAATTETLRGIVADAVHDWHDAAATRRARPHVALTVRLQQRCDATCFSIKTAGGMDRRSVQVPK